MHYKSAMFFTLFSAAISIQAFTISGTVSTKAGTVLSGTAVTLTQTGLTEVTDSVGYFSFEDIVASTRSAARSASVTFCSIKRLHNDRYQISLPEKSALQFEIFDAAGRVLLNVTRPTEAYDHQVTVPVRSEGLHVCRVTFNQTQRIFTSIGAGMVTPGVFQGSPAGSGGPASVSADAAAFTDVLSVSSNGLLTYRREVTDADTAELAIKMIPLRER